MVDKRIGHYAFIVGVIIAIIAGLFPTAIASTALLLVILGIVVGFLNITAAETDEFLISTIALMVAGGAGLAAITWANLGIYLESIIGNITIFVAPAAIVVALKAIFSLAEK
jgi:hypothetical protein